MKRVLLTGFEPFDGAPTNSSWEAVERVAGGWDGPATLVTARLPVEFGRAADLLDDLIARHSPDVVIATGLANGRASITPERVAVNLASARIDDNAGNRPLARKIVVGGAETRPTGLPVDRIVRAMRAEGVPAQASLSAGTFVCNEVMYRLLARADSLPELLAGFIHVPCSPALASGTAQPFLELDVIARGLAAAVEACVR
jgi:pyroglutamyl-peptidase